MRVTVDRAALADATKKAGKFLPRMANIPVLGHYLVEAHSGILAVTAFDMEAGRRVEVEAQVQVEGDVLIPPALAKVVAGSKADKVTLDADDTEVTIEAGKARAKLRLGRRDDYPEGFEPGFGDAVEVPVKHWERIRSVCIAASRDTPRPVLMGVKLEGGLAVATDSYRLAWAEFTDVEDHPEVVVPARAVQALDADVKALYVGDRNVKAKLTDGAWWVRPIEGAFPKWRSLLSDDEGAISVTVDCEELSAAVKRATGAVEPNHVALSPDGREVQVIARHQDKGEYIEDIPAKIDGDRIDVAFNPSYLLDAMSQTEQITLRIFDQTGPVLVEGESWWRGLIMPVRT